MTTHLEDLRRAELLSVLQWIPRNASTILEIGAGAGWQARELTKLGFKVAAIDLAESNYDATGIFDVARYDGVNIPFPDASFDVVFSSNVLEHVRDTKRMQEEIHRVLVPAGIAIHVMPTASWRFWTSLSHYPWLFTAGVRFVRRKIFGSKPTGITPAPARERPRRSPASLAFRAMFSPVHGERGNAVTELFYFSGRYWKEVFDQHGWVVLHAVPNRLFYSGYSVLDSRWTIAMRRSLSRVLGSSCRIYVLKPVEQSVNRRS